MPISGQLLLQRDGRVELQQGQDQGALQERHQVPGLPGQLEPSGLPRPAEQSEAWHELLGDCQPGGAEGQSVHREEGGLQAAKAKVREKLNNYNGL